MALDFLKYHDSALEKSWNAKPAKPAKDPMPAKRKKLMDAIDGALEQLKAGEANPKRGMYSTKDGVEGVKVQLKYGQRPLTLNGKNSWVVPDAGKFFLDAKTAIEGGHLDAAINDMLMSGKVLGSARSATDSLKPKRVMSDEHRAKIAAAAKARHAARKAK